MRLLNGVAMLRFTIGLLSSSSLSASDLTKPPTSGSYRGARDTDLIDLLKSCLGFLVPGEIGGVVSYVEFSC